MDSSKIPAGITDLELRKQKAKLWNEYAAAEDALENAPEGADLDELSEARDAAGDAVDALESQPLLIDENYEIYRCAICGIPLWDADEDGEGGDEVLEDAETGELVLRAAAGMPPRPKKPEETDELEEEAA
jgi:hypothetical protein